MNPQLKAAFDVMIEKAEPFIHPSLRVSCADSISGGNFIAPAGAACEGLLQIKSTASTAQAHRTAVTAFGAFWEVFTALTYGATPSAPVCAVCGQKKGGNQP